MKPNDENIIIGIRESSRKIIDYLNTYYYPSIEKLVIVNSGTIQDAEDLYQEVLYIVCEKVNEPGFKLSCKFQTFFYTVGRYRWLAKLRDRKIKPVEFDEMEYDAGGNYDLDRYEKELNKLSQFKLYRKHFEKLNVRCKRILSLFLENMNFDEIQSIMNIKSKKYAWKLKFDCNKQLIDNIKNDPEYVGIKEKYYELTREY